jgi:hypothetical protein
MTVEFFRWVVRRCAEKAAELYTIPRLVKHGKALGGTRQINMYSYSYDLPDPKKAIESANVEFQGQVHVH